jgi:hypothetical protein
MEVTNLRNRERISGRVLPGRYRRLVEEEGRVLVT